MNSSDISVIIPVFNAERYLEKAIDSVLSQNLKPGELIIVDDGSTDESRNIARRFSPFTTLISQTNMGAAAARNKGIQASKGSLLAFLDADDVWKPDKLQLQLDLLRADSDLDMVFGGVEQFISPELSGQSLSRLRPELKMMPGYVMGTLLIRRSSFFKVGFLEESFRIGEFIDWFDRAKTMGLTHHMLDTIVLKRRIHESNQGIANRSHSKDYIAVIKKILDRKR